MFATGMPVAQFLRVSLAFLGGIVARFGGKTPDLARKVAGSLGSASEATKSTLSRLASARPQSEVTQEERDLLVGQADAEEEDEEEYEEEYEEEDPIHGEEEEYEEEE
ncbi:MAG: hypothetical protein GWP39_08180, partial [Planctomycetia bacterium]|nr:hypothetical protein [Planctomycetia bacterium]